VSDIEFQCEDCGSTDVTSLETGDGFLCNECDHTTTKRYRGKALNLATDGATPGPWATENGETVAASDDDAHDGAVSTDWLPDDVHPDELTDTRREILRAYATHPGDDPSYAEIARTAGSSRLTASETLQRYVEDVAYQDLSTKRKLIVDIIAMRPELSRADVGETYPVSKSLAEKCGYVYPDLINERADELDRLEDSVVYQDLVLGDDKDVVGDDEDGVQDDTVDDVEEDAKTDVQDDTVDDVQSDDEDGVQDDTVDDVQSDDEDGVQDDPSLTVSLDEPQVESILRGELPDTLEDEVRDTVLSRALGP